MVLNKITKLKRLIDEHYENIKNITIIIKLELDKKHKLAIDKIILKICKKITLLNELYNNKNKNIHDKKIYSRSTIEYKNIDEYNFKKIEEIKEIFNKTKTKTEYDYLTINKNIKNLEEIVEQKITESDVKQLLKQLLKKLQLLFIISNPFIIRDINNKISILKKNNSPIVTNNFISIFSDIQSLVNKENNKDYIEYINKKKTYDSKIEKYITDYSSKITDSITNCIQILNCRFITLGDSADNNERCNLVAEFEKLKKYI